MTMLLSPKKVTTQKLKIGWKLYLISGIFVAMILAYFFVDIQDIQYFIDLQ